MMASGAGHDGSAGATMDEIGTALVVPVVAAVLSTLVIAFGLRRCDCPEMGAGLEKRPSLADASA
jgi:hypothetical protein